MQNTQKTMKALVKRQLGRGLWLEDVPMPKITNPNDVLIKIKRTGICGTDLHIYKWDEWAARTVPLSLVVGHEFVGEVVDIGRHVTRVKVGTMVSGEGHIVCGTCRNCLAGREHYCADTKGVGVNHTGVFAEYAVLPESNVWICSPAVDERMYSFFDPFGNAVHTALSFPLVGEDVLVTGAGPIGIMCAVIAMHAGARHVVLTDVNEYRLELARKMGVKHTINPTQTQIKKYQELIGMREGFDVGLETSGNGSAYADLVENMVNGGKISLLGLHGKDTKINWDKVIFGSLTIKGIYGREMYDTWYKMESLLKSGLDLSQLITHEFSYEDFEQGFKIMESANCGKVILNWSE